MLLRGLAAAEEPAEARFEIKAFEVTGNTLFSDDQVRSAVILFTGPDRSTADVEKARDSLEKKYHDAGYPAVMVNIPEQTLQDGIVKLQVIESRIGKVKVTGNRYYTMDKVLRDLPSLTPGRMLYLPQVQQEIARLNRGQDFKVEPVMSPGKEVGTIDVELKIEDHLPLHGSLELNNRSSPDTVPLRLNAAFHYDNLWQREHSFSFEYQVSPQDREQVQAISASYALPAPWQTDDQWMLYDTWSDSNTAFGESFSMIGKGNIIGTRYIMLLPEYRLYTHTVTFGLDYKHVYQRLGFGASTAQEIPVTYTPVSVSYGASLPDEWGGMNQFSAGINMAFRGVVSDQEQFANKNANANADYLYATATVQRTQKLPKGMNLSVKVDGQLSDQPLIDSEQYSAGGMESVRGYKESTVLGDSALHGMLELTFPDPFEGLGAARRIQMTPLLFTDAASLTVIEPLDEQKRRARLWGAGAGVRGAIGKNLEYEFDWAVALQAFGETEKYDQRYHWKIKALF